MRIDRTSLGPLRKLGNGNSGDVYEIVGTGTVFKEFNQRALALTDIRLWAAGSVAFWHSLTPAEQAELATLAVWPTATVHDRGDVVGVVMPLLPDFVFHDRVGKDGSVERQVSELKWLLVPRNKLVGRFDVAELESEVVRYELLGRAFAVLAWLHAHGVCFGDISHGNFVFGLNPPRVLAMDTDAVVTGPGTASPHGRLTPYYNPPEMEGPRPHDRIDEKVDVWKAATLALRALTPGPGAFQRRPDDVAMLVGKAPDRVVDLLGRALGADRDLRPSMAELSAAFLDHVARLSSPPVAVRLDIVDRVVRRGSWIELEWELDGAETVVVDTPDGVRHELDAAQHRSGFRFVAERTGLIAVHAANRHGTSTFPLGPVHVYEVPQVAMPTTRTPAPGVRTAPRPVLPGRAGLPPLPALPTRPVLGTDRFRVTLQRPPRTVAGPDALRARLAAQRADINARLARLFSR